MAWASFCISTFKRPQFLQLQIESLLNQTFTDFEIVISDNDPNASGEEIVKNFKDNRIRYYNNQENLGMIKSFNKSIERAQTDYIIMVTDDDPIDYEFLSSIYQLYKQYPDFALYGGFTRNNKKEKEIEIIEKEKFITEILDWNKTPNLLWSSCVLEKSSVLKVGKIPDYGSPHLADHALLALVGNEKGGIIVNHMYSSLNSHDNNFSKFNFETYFSGCSGFYDTMTNKTRLNRNYEEQKKIIIFHLKKWFIMCVFNLKKYYTIINPDKSKLESIDLFSKKMRKLSFMEGIQWRYNAKQFIFSVKTLFKLF